ncbi:response regulator [Alsobacter sp. KACC 23698]
MLTIVTKMLAEIGVHDVDCAGDVESALAHVRVRDYDVLILDYFLGDQTGDDLMFTLRHEGEDIPAIIMTGEAARAATHLRQEVDWLRKPFTATELKARIAAAL